MRGAGHPDPVMNAVELGIAEQAYSLVTNNPNWSGLPFKTAYSFIHLNTFYGSQNPEIIKLIQRLQPYPRYIEMEVIQALCPLRCIQCEATYWDEKPIKLSFKDFKATMDQFDLLWAGNNALGDPFLNPEYPDMVKYIDDQEIPQEIYMTTFLLNNDDMRKFVDYKSFLLTKISFDAATSETYEKIRVGSNFDKVVSNIKALDKYKRQRGKHWPQLEFHYLIMKQNIHECLQFLDFIDSLDIVCSGVMFSRLLHYFPEIKDVYCDVPVELGQKLIERGKQLGIPVYFNGDASACKPPAYNCLQYLMPYVFPEGTVVPCCNPNEANMRWWQRENSMGNVFKTPFREIWNGEKYRQLRQTLSAGNPVDYMPVCKNLCAVHDIGCKR